MYHKRLEKIFQDNKKNDAFFDEIGISKENFRKLFSEKSSPNLKTIIKISKAANVSVGWIMGEPDTSELSAQVEELSARIEEERAGRKIEIEAATKILEAQLKAQTEIAEANRKLAEMNEKTVNILQKSVADKDETIETLRETIRVQAETIASLSSAGNIANPKKGASKTERVPSV